MDEGKVTRVSGDPDCLTNRGSLCAKGLASLEFVFHRDRIRRPLRRAGERGEGRWQEISWDEALDIVAGELARAKAEFGPESVGFVQGAARGLQDSYGERFANAFGTPNFSTTGHVCFAPRAYASGITCGFDPIPDYDHPPACIVVWGANMAATRIGEHKQTVRAVRGGTQLIVVDPRKTALAARAHTWLRLRPGSDLALALGMIHVIVNQGLFDRDFVDSWTIGFDRLKDHVQEYTPQWAEEITWVQADAIRQAAVFYATTKPACIRWGNAIDHNVNSFQTARAISILRAITGNLRVAGGEMQCLPLGLLECESPEFVLWESGLAGRWDRRVGADRELIPPFHRVPSQSLIRAILEEERYPIHALFIQGANPLVTYPNARRVYEALGKLRFLAVVSMSMTPTAAMADIVLPVASYLEFDNIVAPPYYPVAQVQQKVTEVGECRSDYEIINGLAKRLGLEQDFWVDTESFLDAVLEPVGLTFEEFKAAGGASRKWQRESCDAGGFPTPSGKVELYSSQLEKWGFEPLPTYREPPETPFSDPELSLEYPLILTTWKPQAYRHGEGRQIASLRRRRPEPIVTVHPATAKGLGIEEGDWVAIETRRGGIKQKAAFSSDIDPRVIIADYGWWFPERGSSHQYDWAESNVNVLTGDGPPFNQEMGSTNLRGIFCRIHKP
jgi:anaerobic selenocysteine-containing dehydrogenase